MVVDKSTNPEVQPPKDEKSPLGDISEKKAKNLLQMDALLQPGTGINSGRFRGGQTLEVAFRDDPKKDKKQLKQAGDETKPTDGKAAVSSEEQTRRDAMAKEADDALERGKLLHDESIAGSWSSKSQETWKKLFDDISKQPGMTADKTVSEFNDLGAKINDQLMEQGVEQRVGMVIKYGADGKTTITMQLNSAKTKDDNAKALAEGKDTATSVKAGSMDTATKPDATDTAKVASGLAPADGPRNASGAYVKPDKHNRAEFIEHKDKSRIVPKWEPDKNGQAGGLAGFDEITADGKYTRSWTREGDKFTSPGPNNTKRVFTNVKFDENNNGNFSYTNEKGQSLTVRGNGAVLATGPNDPKYTFDKQGRIENIIPAVENWSKGAPSQHFTYAGETNKLQSISELTIEERKKGSKGTTRPAKEGEIIADNGDYKYPDTIRIGGKELSITRVHHPGTTPDADDRQKTFTQADGSIAVTHFNAQGKFVGVEGFSRDGKLLKTYTTESDTQIKEVDHVASNTTIWDKGDNNVSHGKRTLEGGKPADRDMGLRQNLDFNNLAELKYNDDKGKWHIEHKDGGQEIGQILPNGTYNVSDEKDRLIKAGMVTSRGPDLNNYLAYKYDETIADKDKPKITQLDMVYKDKSSEMWTPTKGRDPSLSENGEFTYINPEGQKVTVRPDLSVSKYTRQEGGLPDLLSEVAFPDGSKRNFAYGELRDPRHPVEAKSSFVAPNGDTMISTFTTMPAVDAVVEPVKPADAAKDDKANRQARLDELLNSIQLLKLTEERIPKEAGKDVPAQTKKEVSEVEAAPVFGLELFSNGDFEATSISTAVRYLFPARGISAFPRGLPVPLDGPDGRVMRDKQNFEAFYKEHLLAKDLASMKPRRFDEKGRLVDKASLGKIPESVTELAYKHITDKLNIPMPKLPVDPRSLSQPQQVQLLTDTAYGYELALAAAIAEEQKANKSK